MNSSSGAPEFEMQDAAAAVSAANANELAEQLRIRVVSCAGSSEGKNFADGEDSSLVRRREVRRSRFKMRITRSGMRCGI